jgi:Tfp pilus assembly protein PilF
MKKTFFIFILYIILFGFLGCSWNDRYFQKYNTFAIKSAQIGLWNEAEMRWKRMVELHPNDARIHNNLAVAYEATGKSELAMIEYKRAVELDPKNSIYLKNYSKFMKNYGKIESKSMKEIRKEEEIEQIEYELEY